jgi:hypothetical protein
MNRSLKEVLAFVLATQLLPGCASPDAARPREGQIALQAGSGGPGPAAAGVVAGQQIRRLAVLMPSFEPAWQAVWTESDRTRPGGQAAGVYSGLLTGLAIVQSVPMLIGFWPAALGVVAGTTALGVLGGQFEASAQAQMDAGELQTLLEAAGALQPDELLREATVQALETRMGRAPLRLPWHATWGPDTPGSFPLADARSRDADGVLDVTVEAFGLAMGEDAETYGVFVRARARLLESAGGQLRYERVLEHGPGRPFAGLPRPATHTLDFLAVDHARVFRYEIREVVERLARILARDPTLPLGAS